MTPPDPRTAEERLRRGIEYVLMRFVNLPFQKEQAFDCRDDLLHVFRAMAERILVAVEPVPVPEVGCAVLGCMEPLDLCADHAREGYVRDYGPGEPVPVTGDAID